MADLRRGLSPWQQQMLDAVLSGQPLRYVPAGRASGRMIAQRYAIAGAVAMSGHLHLVARDGLWCVTATDIGMLWERLR